MVPWKAKYMAEKGIDIDRLERRVQQMHGPANNLVAAHKAKSGVSFRPQAILKADREEIRIEDGEEVIYECETNDEGLELCVRQMTGEEKRRYAEAILLGIVDGIVAYFSRDCHAGLITFIASAFRMIDHYEIWIPNNTMKFNMSLNSFMEASNVVFAYCDVSHFQTEIEHLTEY